LKRIVVIDANKRDLKLISSLLRRENFDVFEFTSGLEGMNWLKNNKSDGCFVDLQLPIINGVEILNEIHSDERHTSTKVICMYTQLNCGEQTIFEYGFDGYVLKPINSKLLLDEIKRIIDYTIA